MMREFVLAYTPLLDPLPYEPYWLVLLLPLVLAIALVYKTIKLPDRELPKLPQQAVWLATEIFAFMVLIAAGLWLLAALM
jgi:hypothetical protein